jgi:hypothetical protein
MTSYPKIIRLPITEKFKDNDVSDISSKLFIKDITTINEHYIEKKLDPKYGNDLLIINPGDDSYILNDANYYAKQFNNTIDEVDKGIINANTTAKLFIYKYTKPNIDLGQYMLYISSPKITDLSERSEKIELIKLGTEIALLIHLYNEEKSDKINNIRLPGISTTTKDIKERYYLNYSRDILLHTMVAALNTYDELKNIDSIQFCDQESNRYDIYGSFEHAHDKKNLDDSLDIKEKESTLFDYYLYNGKKYISHIQNSNEPTKFTLNTSSNFYTINENITEINTKEIDVDLNLIVKDLFIKDMIDKYYNQINNIPKVDVKGTYIKSVNGKNTNNLCWFNSSNQFILSINEIANYLLTVDTSSFTELHKKFFNIIKEILSLYGGEEGSKISSDNHNKLKAAFIELSKINEVRSILKIDFGSYAEILSYLDCFLSLTPFNNTTDYVNILEKYCGSIRVNFKSMYYQNLKYRTVSYIGNSLEGSKYDIVGGKTIFSNFIVTIDLLTLLMNLSSNYLDQSYLESNSVSGWYYYTVLPMHITSKYIIVKNYPLTGNPYTKSKTVVINIKLKNGFSYKLKSIVFNKGGSHYVCYRINGNKLFKYDDIDESKVTESDISNFISINIGDIPELILYELTSDVVDSKKINADFLEEEYIKEINDHPDFINLDLSKQGTLKKKLKDTNIKNFNISYEITKQDLKDKKDPKDSKDIIINPSFFDVKPSKTIPSKPKKLDDNIFDIKPVKPKLSDDNIFYDKPSKIKQSDDSVVNDEQYFFKPPSFHIIESVDDLEYFIPLKSYSSKNKYSVPLKSYSSKNLSRLIYSIPIKPNDNSTLYNNYKVPLVNLANLDTSRIPGIFTHKYLFNDDSYTIDKFKDYDPVDLTPYIFLKMLEKYSREDKWPLINF